MNDKNSLRCPCVKGLEFQIETEKQEQIWWGDYTMAFVE